MLASQWGESKLSPQSAPLPRLSNLPKKIPLHFTITLLVTSIFCAAGILMLLPADLLCMSEQLSWAESGQSKITTAWLTSSSSNISLCLLGMCDCCWWQLSPSLQAATSQVLFLPHSLDRRCLDHISKHCIPSQALHSLCLSPFPPFHASFYNYCTSYKFSEQVTDSLMKCGNCS